MDIQLFFYPMEIIWSRMYEESYHIIWKRMLHHHFSRAKTCLCVCPVYNADQQHCICTYDLIIEYSISKAGKRLEFLIGRRMSAKKTYSSNQKIKSCVKNGSAVLVIFKLMYLSASFFYWELSWQVLYYHKGNSWLAALCVVIHLKIRISFILALYQSPIKLQNNLICNLKIYWGTIYCLKIWNNKYIS